MEKSRIGAIGHQLKGTLKEGLGKIIGDAKLASDGSAEQEAGETQNTAGAAANPLVVMGVDTDRIAGIGHQLKGALKEKLGKLNWAHAPISMGETINTMTDAPKR